MACHGYLQLEGRHFLIEYIVRNCTHPVGVNEDSKAEVAGVPTADVRAMCRNILNAFSSTIDGMDEVRARNNPQIAEDCDLSDRFYGHC